MTPRIALLPGGGWVALGIFSKLALSQPYSWVGEQGALQMPQKQ